MVATEAELSKGEVLGPRTARDHWRGLHSVPSSCTLHDSPSEDSAWGPLQGNSWVREALHALAGLFMVNPAALEKAPLGLHICQVGRIEAHASDSPWVPVTVTQCHHASTVGDV